MPTPIEIANNKLTTCQQIINKLRAQIFDADILLDTVRTNAIMAMIGKWDKSDSGFDYQIKTISKHFKTYNYE